MNYLIYVEHAAENLQFYLWLRDYTRRFAELPPSEAALSPEWVAERAEHKVAAEKMAVASKGTTPRAAEIFKSTDFAQPKHVAAEPSVNVIPFDDPLTPGGAESTGAGPERTCDDEKATIQDSRRPDHARKAADAFETADVKVQPCRSEEFETSMARMLIACLVTIQPFREEIARIIAIYIDDGAARQLNLASRERTALLRALAVTTHPSAFRRVIKTVERTLRLQAHPNFIRWSIRNGNRPRVAFARCLGVGGIIGGIVCIVLLTVSAASRPWRVVAAIPLFIGTATLIAAWKGMCVVSSALPLPPPSG
jgi:hypothetical protein